MRGGDRVIGIAGVLDFLANRALKPVQNAVDAVAFAVLALFTCSAQICSSWSAS